MRRDIRFVASSGDWVGIRLKDILIISCYLSPNEGMIRFKQSLKSSKNVIRGNPDKVLLCGDLNARSVSWGCNTGDARGALLESWISELDLIVLNRGKVSTCVRPQDSSVVDLSVSSHWVSRCVEDWHVEDTAETLSDHAYVLFLLDTGVGGTRRGVKYPRWNLKSLDTELFKEVINWCFECYDSTAVYDGTKKASWLSSTITRATDCAAKRSSGNGLAKSKYWWSQEIADARSVCMRRKRALTRAREKAKCMLKGVLYNQYKSARKELRVLIRKAKERSWSELIDGIERDPWGLPYKMVLNKLRRTTSGLSEELEEGDLKRLLESLFPMGESHDPRTEWMNCDVLGEIPEISLVEVEAALKRGNAVKAPGPDGITLAILRRAPPILLNYIAETFSTCLKEGVFLNEWKKARLVLIPKDKSGRSSNEIRARPICLINELGKLFERVLVDRMYNFMEDSPLDILSARQFGFRKGRSTIDALDSAAGTIYYWWKKRYPVIAVGLDVTNAFNSIPWPAIRNALRAKSFPAYIRRILDDYLNDRRIEYPVRDEGTGHRYITCGVPQGSVLGPLLWNITFNFVLEVRPHAQCTVLCYADDTLILAAGVTVADARSRANEQTVTVCRRIEALGLKITPNKTEAVMFYSGRRPDMGTRSYVLRGHTSP